jgi:hypothetical protein
MTENLSSIPEAAPDVAPDATMVSRSGTRNIIDQAGQSTIGRTRALCGYGMYAEEELPEALRDCDFRQREATEARRKAAAEALIQARARSSSSE